MIRRLKLRNWRNYADVAFDFHAGTTFVVASNGVGKTSLVEAARWALFGTIAPGGNAAIRAGADHAFAAIELELPDLRILSVERTLTSKSRNADTPVVRLDGAPVSPEQLNQHLLNAYDTEPHVLAALTMPAIDRDHDKPTALRIEEHLGRYYGIDGLKEAIGRLKELRRANDTRIRQVKHANSPSSQRLVQLHSEAEQAELRVEEAAARYKAAQDRVDKARERQRVEAEMKKWRDRHAAWVEAVEILAARVSVDLGRPLDVDGVETALDERLADLDQRIETIRVEIAVIAAKAQALTSNEERLDAAHDDCPVCRRPLDDTTISRAHASNQQDISAIRGSISKLRSAETDLIAQRERLKSAQTEWRRVPQPGQPPQIPPGDDEHVAVAELGAMAETALSVLVDARAAHVQATRALNEARAADKAMRELESLFRREASLRVAAEATEATLKQLLDETIRPLAAEVNQRWTALFPDRGKLHTRADGSITRTVNGHPLPYDSFSTGEGMSTTILLRLLVVQMATMADFCWFDEPLEHLDPDVRRRVASLLSSVTSGEGPLRQVVVTTYEEPLARLLQARDEQSVRLVDVRHRG
ncbi:AAA family ATPase [Microbispora rosea]|uniref:AAA family ATPase n=1 Tax=Microbispora rosea TaxID=58117 RepID=UPI003438CC39